MPLLTYTETRPYAAAIRAATSAKVMPPWFADPRYGTFKNAHVLTDAQIATLAAWAEGGAPEGAGSAPAAPVFKDGWSGRIERPPDLVVELPAEFELPATGIVPVFTLMGEAADPRREVHRGDGDPSGQPPRRAPLQRVGGTLPPGTRLGRGAAWDGGPEMDGVPQFRDGKPFRAAGAESFGKPLLFYVPAGGFQQYPERAGQARGRRTAPGLGRPSDDHRKTGEDEDPARPLVRQTRRAPRDVHLDGQRAARGGRAGGAARRARAQHPAGAPNWAMTGQLRFKEDVTLYALWPHMHYRGKDMTFVLTRPDGKDETLLSVPRYNPNWQFTYELATPLKIKARSVLTAYGHYDNSAANRFNPAPTRK